MSFQDLSIGKKLSLSITLTSCVSLLIACGAFLAYDVLSYREIMVDELEDLAVIVGDGSTRAILAGDPQAVGEAVVAVSVDPHIVSAFVFSNSGEMLGGYLREDAGDTRFPHQEPPGHRFENDNLILFHQILQEGEPVGTLVLRSDLEEMRGRLKRYAEVLGLVLGVAVLSTLMISVRLQRVLTRPIHALVDAVRKVSEHGNYAVRVRKEADDEVGALTGAFNHMLSEIQARDAALRDAHGKLRSYATEQTKVARDEASGRLHAEEALRESEQQLRQSQKMEAIGRLAGGVAHDFNNLLTVIGGYSQIMLSKLEQKDPFWEKIDEIRKAGERAAGLTRQLLAFSRKQVLRPEVFRPIDVIREMEKMLRRIIGEDVELDISTPEGLGHVRADRGQIEQVLLNLAVNARDAMPDGGRLSIEVDNVDRDPDDTLVPRTDPGSHVRLEVTDTGCGMDDETMQQIFEPFFTTKEEGKGTGLGLSTVYGIVQQSGGDIECSSRIGVGSRFRILLPTAEEQAGAGAVSELRTEAPRGCETILLVEDESGVRKLARGILEDYGYRVLEAPHGGEALMLCERHSGRIDLMLTDVVMPYMSGRELCDRLAPLRPDMRVLYMSGHTDHTIVHEGVLEPGLAFLPKPFTPEGLARKIRETIDEEPAAETVS